MTCVNSAAGLAVGDVVRRRNGRQPYSDTIGTDLIDHRGVHFEEKPCPILDRSAARVVALVCAIAQELVDQVSVGRVHLDPIELGRDRVGSALAKFRDQVRDLVNLQGTRLRHLDEFAANKGFGSCANGRGTDRSLSPWLQRYVRDSTDVPKLQKDVATPCVYPPGHVPPTFDLFRGMNTGGRFVPLPPGQTWVASVMIRPAEARCA
jgi:hypothetical protein